MGGCFARRASRPCHFVSARSGIRAACPWPLPRSRAEPVACPRRNRAEPLDHAGASSSPKKEDTSTRGHRQTRRATAGSHGVASVHAPRKHQVARTGPSFTHNSREQHLDTQHQSAQPNKKPGGEGGILERDRTRHQCSTVGEGGEGETRARARRSHEEAQSNLRQRQPGCEACAQGRARRRAQKNAGASSLPHGLPPWDALRGSQREAAHRVHAGAGGRHERLPRVLRFPSRDPGR